MTQQTAPVTGAVGRPEPEVRIDADLVRRLLAGQHPDLADLPLEHLDAGWDNVIFRLGPELLVRLPRRELAAPLVLHEQRWLPGLAGRLPLPVPAPVRVGEPAEGYPWRWSVLPWFAGASALSTPPRDPVAAAEAIGGFLAALHQPAPPDAPPNPYRGIPLADRDDLTRTAIEELPADVDQPTRRRLAGCWAAHVDLPRWEGPALWLHGDLHPHNVLVHDGAVSAVIDFGDLTAGDPATDLGIAWMLLPPPARLSLRDARGVDDATWARGRGWALALALAYLASPLSTDDFRQLGRTTLAAVLDDAGTT